MDKLDKVDKNKSLKGYVNLKNILKIQDYYEMANDYCNKGDNTKALNAVKKLKKVDIKRVQTSYIMKTVRIFIIRSVKKLMRLGIRLH